MYEIYTCGNWDVEPANEEAFLAAWTEFASWASSQPGAGMLRLTRDVRKPGRFVSFGLWDDADAVRSFKGAPEFKDRIRPVVRLTTAFEPTELYTLVKVDDGTAEEVTPPAELEPIHTPT
jgi:heme-degrading monooxygenase HmoA